MKTHSRKLLTWLLLVSILSTYALLLPSVLASKNQDPNAPQRQAEAISVLAEYMTGGGDSAGRLLARYNYSPDVDLNIWRQYSAVKKITTAYLAAHTANPTQGGERFLALLSQDMARMYDSAKVDPTLKPYLDIKLDYLAMRGDFITFRHPTSPPVVGSLPSNVVSAIDTISEYASKGPVGSPQSILTSHFNLTETEAFQVLNEHGSTEKALKAVFEPLSNQARVEKLKELTAKVARVYEAVAYEESLKPYLPVQPDNRRVAPVAAVRPDVPPSTDSGGGTGAPPTGPGRGPSTGPSNPSPPSGSGGGGTGAPSAGGPTGPGMGSPETKPGVTPSQKYNSYIKKNYPSPTSRNFSKMSLRVRGFGGVIFGNEVTDNGLPRIKTVNYEIEPSATTGRVQVVFQDDTRASFPNVSPEDAYASYKIVFSGIGEVEALTAGEGVGLVGVDNPVRLTQCNEKQLELRDGRSFNVVMHPALADSDLGWSALMVDILPIRRKNLLNSVEKKAGIDTRIAMDQLFDTMLSSKFLGTWKVVDVPMNIRLEKGILSTIRTEEPGRNHPAGLRQTAFIAMHPLIQGDKPPTDGASEDSSMSDYDKDFADRFYRMVPILTNASYDYKRLNTFASILALFRWAKAKGATANLVLSAPKRVTTPGAINIFESSIEPASDSSSALRNAIKTVDECLRQAESSQATKEYRAKEMQIQKLEDEYDQLLSSKIANPPKEPIAVREMEAKLKSLEDQLDEAERSIKVPPEVRVAEQLRYASSLMKRELVYLSNIPE